MIGDDVLSGIGKGKKESDCRVNRIVRFSRRLSINIVFYDVHAFLNFGSDELTEELRRGKN